jgi:hypothetical protein
MTKEAIAAILALALAAPALADVTIRASGTGKGLGMSGTTSSTTYIKGQKMRVDGTLGKKPSTTIFDVESQKMYVLDPGKKEAEVWDMTTLSQEISSAITLEGVRASIKPNGLTKAISGHNAEGYDIDIAVPATMGGSGGVAVMIAMNGTAWIVKGAPGTKDYSDFYLAASERGWLFSDPRAAKAQPGQAKAMAQMYAEFAKLGGLPYESNIEIKLQAEGMMGGMLAKLGGVTMSTTTDSVEAAPLADELFAPPADYTLKQRD